MVVLAGAVALWIIPRGWFIETEITAKQNKNQGLTEQILIDTEFVFYSDLWSSTVPGGKPVAFLKGGEYQIEGNPLKHTWRFVDSATVQIDEAICRYDKKIKVLVCPHEVEEAPGFSFYVVRTSDREQWLQTWVVVGYDYFVNQAIESIEACLHWGGEIGDQTEQRNQQIKRSMAQDCALAEQNVDTAFENRSNTPLLASKIILLIDRGHYIVDKEKKEAICESAQLFVKQELSHSEEGYAYQVVCS